jgi:type I restriction enzyme R subunit
VGAANNEGSWRAILEHFAPAVHLGLTATPKRTDNIDTYNYFGHPAYEYSLKDGINDGFLTPYRVKRIRTNLDELVLTADDEIIKGESTQDVYDTNDFDNKIVADQRTELVAQAILQNINPLEKTIVFCINQNHALTMRDMINTHKTVADPHYCVRVISDEGKPGRDLLERFQDNDRDIPTILTSSQMLTTPGSMPATCAISCWIAPSAPWSSSSRSSGAALASSRARTTSPLSIFAEQPTVFMMRTGMVTR